MLSFTKTTNQRLLRVARGEEEADLVIPRTKLVDVWNSEIYATGVAIKGNRIAFVGQTDHTVGKHTRIMRCDRSYLIPGLMDAHTHIESTKLTLPEFAKIVVPRGTTSVFVDPIQCCTSMGWSAVELMMKWASKLPLRVFVTIPDGPLDIRRIVRGTQWVRDQDQSTLEEVEHLLKTGNVAGFGETSYREDVRGKIEATLRKELPVWGGLPDASALELNSNVIVGISNDHDFDQVNEAIARARLGMTVVIVEGSLLRNVDSFTKAIMSGRINPDHCCFATDDKIVSDLLAEGGIDYAVRKSVRAGLDPIVAIRMATLNCAKCFCVDEALGSISPGKIADFLILDDLDKVRVDKVVVDGKVVSARTLAHSTHPRYPRKFLRTFPQIARIGPSDFRVKGRGRDIVDVLVIRVRDGSIFNQKVTVRLPWVESNVVPDLKQDVAKIGVIEKFSEKTMPAIGLGFIQGLGIEEGAVGVCQAWTPPSVVVTGFDDFDLALAANQIRKMQGGYCVVKNGTVLGKVETPFVGVCSIEPAKVVRRRIDKLEELLQKELCCSIGHPFMTISFQAIAGLRSLRLTPHGLWDSTTRRLVSLFP